MPPPPDAAPGAASKYVVVWRLTEACDLDCTFCSFAKSHRYHRQRAQAATVLRFSRVLADWAADDGVNVLMSWLGGEPLLWPGIIDVTRRVRSYGLQTSVTTNGTALVRGHVDVDDLTVFNELTLSLDGYREQHDLSRGVQGLYDTVLATVEQLNATALHVTTRVNVLLTAVSIKDFESIVADCAGAGATEITFNTLWAEASSPAASLQPSPSDIEHFQELLATVRRIYDRRCRILGSPGYLDRLRSYASGHPTPVVDCRPGTRTLFVDADGTVAPCAYTTRAYGIPVGELQTVASVRQLAARLSQQRSLGLAPACLDCPDTNVFGKHDEPA